MQIFGVILAGGRGSRIGGADKAFLSLGGQPLVGHAIARLSPQVAALAINANGDGGRFARFGVPVLSDPVAGWPGPLAGVLAGLDWAASEGADGVVSVAVDTPFFPGDLVPRLRMACDQSGQPIALARTATGWHPTFGLWPVTLRAALRAALVADQRRVLSVAQVLGAGFADFPDTAPDGFFNINTEHDLAQAEAFAGRQP